MFITEYELWQLTNQVLPVKILVSTPKKKNKFHPSKKDNPHQKTNNKNKTISTQQPPLNPQTRKCSPNSMY